MKRGEVLCSSISKASLCANAHTWNLINLLAHLSERRNCKNTVPSASALQTPVNSSFELRLKVLDIEYKNTIEYPLGVRDFCPAPLMRTPCLAFMSFTVVFPAEGNMSLSRLGSLVLGLSSCCRLLRLSTRRPNGPPATPGKCAWRLPRTFL